MINMFTLYMVQEVAFFGTGLHLTIVQRKAMTDLAKGQRRNASFLNILLNISSLLRSHRGQLEIFNPPCVIFFKKKKERNCKFRTGIFYFV